MMLTTKGRYAVASLVDIACVNDGAPVNLKNISARQNLPLSYLETIFCKLRIAGLVSAIKGPGGGYLLNKPLAQINIKEIIDAVEEKIEMTRCSKLSSKEGCVNANSKCITHDLWHGLGQHISNYLSSITVEDIIENRL